MITKSYLIYQSPEQVIEGNGTPVGTHPAFIIKMYFFPRVWCLLSLTIFYGNFDGINDMLFWLHYCCLLIFYPYIFFKSLNIYQKIIIRWLTLNISKKYKTEVRCSRSGPLIHILFAISGSPLLWTYKMRNNELGIIQQVIWQILILKIISFYSAQILCH